MTVYQKLLPIKGCKLTKEPVLVLYSTLDGKWYSPIEISTFTGEFISARIPVELKWNRSQYPDRFPTTQEVASSFNCFQKKAIRGEYSLLLEATQGFKGIKASLRCHTLELEF